jgi:hypothetical protein
MNTERDAFEAWWKENLAYLKMHGTNKNHARAGWNAATERAAKIAENTSSDTVSIGYPNMDWSGARACKEIASRIREGA